MLLDTKETETEEQFIERFKLRFIEEARDNQISPTDLEVWLSLTYDEKEVLNIELKRGLTQYYVRYYPHRGVKYTSFETTQLYIKGEPRTNEVKNFLLYVIG
jgi:hypothetical protein